MNYHTTGVDNSSADAVAIEDVPNDLDALPTDEFLKILGSRVRQQRSTKNMSRKRLAEVSGVSERYLAQLESGQGNMSIALLRKVTSSIGMSLRVLFSANTAEFRGNGAERTTGVYASPSLDRVTPAGMSMGSVSVSGSETGATASDSKVVVG